MIYGNWRARGHCCRNHHNLASLNWAWTAWDMGDRYDREQMNRRRRFGGMKIPEPILRWGLGVPASIGHNNGPPLDEEPGYLLRRAYWSKAHKEAWKTPPLAILKFRVARAEAAGVTYQEYMSTLLDTGRHLQAADVIKRKS